MLAARSLTCGLLATAGCFYIDAINERPSAEIRRIGDGEVFRGAELMVRAVVYDHDGDNVELSWRAQACDGPAGGAGTVCAAVETSIDPLFAFTVPAQVGGRPTLDVYVDLDVVDAHGAVAQPSQRLELPVGNRPPLAIVQLAGREIEGQFPPGVPITVNAIGDDPDRDEVTLTWQLFPASTSRPEDVVFEPAAAQPAIGEAYTLIPDVEGEWIVRVTADDGIETRDTDTSILVRPDHAPCLGATEPPAATVLAFEPRRFAVLVVADDLDIFPAPPPGDPFLEPARFAWSMRVGGTGAFAAISDAAAVDLDPAAFAPGDRVELRVEIDDRNHRSFAACDPDAPTCNLELPVSCLQRKTWTVEVR
jgi:hypothetical protein